MCPCACAPVFVHLGFVRVSLLFWARSRPENVGKSMSMLAVAWSHEWQHGATCVNTDFLIVSRDVSPRGMEPSMPTLVVASMQPHAST